MTSGKPIFKWETGPMTKGGNRFCAAPADSELLPKKPFWIGLSSDHSDLKLLKDFELWTGQDTQHIYPSSSIN